VGAILRGRTRRTCNTDILLDHETKVDRAGQKKEQERRHEGEFDKRVPASVSQEGARVRAGSAGHALNPVCRR